MLFRSWRRGFARDADRSGDPFTKVVSSLVFHQVPMEEKRRGIEAMARTVVPGGEVHVADYARQRSRLMRTLFGLVQRLDGAENTEPNARGAIEAILADLDHDSGRPSRIVRTPTGEISLFRLDVAPPVANSLAPPARSAEHTSELQSLTRISYHVLRQTQKNTEQ